MGKLDDILKSAKDIADKSLKVSKEALDKAGDTVQNLGNKGIIKIEITQLNQQLKKVYTTLGEKTYEVLVTKKTETLGAKDESIVEIIKEITHLNKEIKTREKEESK